MKSCKFSRTLAKYFFGLCLLMALAFNVQAAATLTSPSDGASYSSSSQVFQWGDGGADISAYALTIGSSLGQDDIYDSGELTADTVSHTATGLGSHQTLYIRFWFRNVDGLWGFSASTLNYGNSVQAPSIYSPVAGSTFDSSSVTVKWRDNGTDVQQYWIYAGSTQGARDYFSQPVNEASEYTVDNLPEDGSQVWIRLWYYTSYWRYQDFDYTASGGGVQQKDVPEMTSPSEHSLLARSEVTFRWQNNNYDPINYWIFIGTAQGDSDIHSSGSLQTANEYVFDGLPAGEAEIYVRLWYYRNGWQYIDYQYSSKLYGEAQIVWPHPGATLAEEKQVFEWSDNGYNVNRYQLLIGSSQGGDDIFDSGTLNNSTLSIEADNLDQPLKTLHVTLRYRISGTWQEQYYRYRRPFVEGFDEPFDADISRWTESYGTWHNADLQRLSTSVGNNFALASYAGAEFSDLDYSARVRRSDDDDNPTFLTIRDGGSAGSSACWCANEGCYSFEISPAQNFAVWSCKSNAWTQVQAFSHSEFINPGTAWNEMRVVAQGEELSFYINGSLLWQGRDDTHASGSVGVGLVNFSDEKINTLDVEWARLTVPAGSR